MNLNTNGWKEFFISDLFDIDTGKDFIYSKAEGNEHPVIGHGLTDNGVACRNDKLEDYTLYDNTTTLSMAHIGNYHAFIQSEPFYLGTRTKALKAKFKTNEYIFEFISTIINFNDYKFSYGRVGSDKIPTEKISLPVQMNEDGTPKIDSSHKYSAEGYIPDWNFMENFIKTLHYKPITTKNKVSESPKLDLSNWMDFNLSRTEEQEGLFDIENCKCSCAEELEDGDDINYIGAKKNDNGVMRRVRFEKDLVSKGNGILFICDGQGSVGYTNYMKEDFIGSTTTAIGYDSELNELNALFLVTILDKERFKYSFGRKYKRNLPKVKISLPVQMNEDGTPKIDSSHKYSAEGYIPDWNLMSNYIKSLPYGDRLFVETTRTEQNRTEQNRTEQNRTEQNRTEQNRTEQNRTDSTSQ